MWIASKLGFFSIVQKQDHDNPQSARYHVRARVKKDIENLIATTGIQTEIRVWPSADYRYRILINQEELHAVMSHLAANLDYGNFKSMIGRTADQREKLSAYHVFWELMGDLQG